MILTGRPGSGKSTIVMKVVEEARKRGLKVGGITTPEVREGGVRVGFLIVDLLTGERVWMARKGLKSAFRVSKYGVDVEAIDRMSRKAIRDVVEAVDVVVVDEIGKMELFSEEFVKAVEKALESGKPFLGTMGLGIRHRLVERIRKDPSVRIVFVNPSNRQKVLGELLSLFAEKASSQ